MYIKNFREVIKKMHLADFIRNVCKKEGIVLNQSALLGREWHIGARTEEGVEAIALSITKSGGLLFLNMEGFYGERFRGEKRILYAGDEIENPGYSKSIMLRDGKLSDSDRESFKKDLERSVDALNPYIPPPIKTRREETFKRGQRILAEKIASKVQLKG
jgi:hypothetical protein